MIRVPLRVFAAAVISALLLQAQPPEPHLAPGRLLVATEESHDPEFAQTVVLLVHYDDQGVLGLILNRRTKVEISRIFRDVPGAKSQTDPVFIGGPVTLGVLGLLRSQKAPEKAMHVFSDVQAITDKDLLEETVTAGKPPSIFRIYIGYTGWTAAQLQNEVERGFWHVLPGSSSIVFDPNPETLWTRLNRKTMPRAYAEPEEPHLAARTADVRCPVWASVN